MKTQLANGLTISVIKGPGTHSGPGTVEIAFWPTGGTGWFIPEEFASYSSDNQVCDYVPIEVVNAYIERVGKA